jgi:hypothetical protein
VCIVVGCLTCTVCRASMCLFVITREFVLHVLSGLLRVWRRMLGLFCRLFAVVVILDGIGSFFSTFCFIAVGLSCSLAFMVYTL